MGTRQGEEVSKTVEFRSVEEMRALGKAAVGEKRAVRKAGQRSGIVK